MNLQKITLVSFGYFDILFLNKIVENIQDKLFVDITTIEGHLDLSDFYDSTRCQYNANELLKQTDNQYSLDVNKTIGLFNVDLFIPIFTYIFGQAYLNGTTGIVSLFRLGNERYGIEADPDILLQRFTKEIIHELGHTFGLIHCHVPDCVMRSSTYVEDIDQRGSYFCIKCRNKIKPGICKL